MSRVILFVMILFLFAGCDMSKTDTTNLTGQGRNYIYFECSTDSIQKGGNQ